VKIASVSGGTNGTSPENGRIFQSPTTPGIYSNPQWQLLAYSTTAFDSQCNSVTVSEGIAVITRGCPSLFSMIFVKNTPVSTNFVPQLVETQSKDGGVVFYSWSPSTFSSTRLCCFPSSWLALYTTGATSSIRFLWGCPLAFLFHASFSFFASTSRFFLSFSISPSIICSFPHGLHVVVGCKMLSVWNLMPLTNGLPNETDRFGYCWRTSAASLILGDTDFAFLGISGM